MSENNLCEEPLFLRGEVVKGFGRGSKQLGIPTANFPESVVVSLPPELDTGIYYGWASVDNGPRYQMVASIGWNPFYQNKKKSIETHIIHEFKEDFYGSQLKIAIVGYIRPETSFTSLDALIAAIRSDIKEAETLLSKPEHLLLKNHDFFSNNHIM